MLNKLRERIRRLLSFKENDFHEFKPALAEIEESPINPLGNFIFWTIITAIIIGGLILYFGKVDVVVTARGMIIPDGEEKFVQTLDKGVITSLDVKEGDFVEKGQVLAIVQPAEYEPGLELANLAQEEQEIKQQIASNAESLKIAKDEYARLISVADILPKSRLEGVKKEVTNYSYEINRLNARLVGIKSRREQIEKQKQILKSPIDGYINTIFVHTESGVVQSAEKIVSVVPKDAKLKIKATVLNQDIGFVKIGMPVLIKVDTFDFQKYGTLNGEITVVSPNSVQNEQFGPVYEVYINLKNKTLLVEHKEENVKIGMSTTCEIKIGKRRIIEFFIYPLIKYLDESIKVR